MNEYEPSDDYPPIVIDNGSSTIRAGFAGDDAPLCVFPNIVGRRRFNIGNKELYVGDEAQSKRELLSLTYPMEHGIVTNWEDMEKVWNHMFFTELHVSPEQHPVLISEPPLNPKGNRETMAQVMFEGYKTPAFHIAFEPVLILFSGGGCTGMVLNVGDGVTHVVPIYEGYALRHAARRSEIAGRVLTSHLQQLLYKRGYSLTSSAEVDMVREMKEQMCFVAKDKFQYSVGKTSSDLEQSFKLPDGSYIKLGHERYQCPEMLFDTTQSAHNHPSLSQLVKDSTTACDINLRKGFYSYIILSGGSTMFSGFGDRLQKELAFLMPASLTSVRVVAAPERKYHVWIGGSILASLTSFLRMWITRQEYNEYGPNILYRKCY